MGVDSSGSTGVIWVRNASMMVGSHFMGEEGAEFVVNLAMGILVFPLTSLF